MRNDHLDQTDRVILEERTATLTGRPYAPGVGDFVLFADGTVRRISHDWGDEVQTSDLGGGRYYLGDGYVSFSGSLHPSVPKTDLDPAHATRPGAVWFFSHDHWTAHNGVEAEAPFRVWTSELDPPGGQERWMGL